MGSSACGVWRLLCVLGATLVAVCLHEGSVEPLRALTHTVYGTPHQRYAARLLWTGTADTETGRAWLDAAHASLAAPARATEARAFTMSSPTATAFAMTVRRGQRYIADVQLDSGPAPFVDIFERDGPRLRHVASAAAGEATVALDVTGDAEYVIRLQPRLDAHGRIVLRMRTEPTLRVPVERARARNIQSFFGDARDEGRRDHHGVDIFAPRGTPVLAASSGVVTSVGTNGLGGNVIWIARPTRSEAHYYAHLDRHAVRAGVFVNAGDVIGYVGNTGNARTTAPHLHFGIYAAGGPVDPLPYLAAL
jgi:murein DD-endopeptidase MepM/ murein hydrolase activator NlpD